MKTVRQQLKRNRESRTESPITLCFQVLILLCGALTSTEAVWSSPYSTAVMGDNPVAYWRLNETSGTTAHDSTSTFDGTYTNGVTLNSAGPPSQLYPGMHDDGAAFFNAANNQYVDLGNDVFNLQSRGTIEGWIRIPELMTSKQAAQIFSTGSETGNNDLWTLHLYGVRDEDSTQTRLRVGYNSPTMNYVYGNTDLQADTWYYVALTGDGATWRMYINSVEESLTINAGSNTGDWWNVPSSGTMRYSIGNLRRATGDRSAFNGILDDIAIYDYVLTDDQILQHYHAALHSGANGDFSGNGVVDGDDFLLWQQDPSIGDLTDWQASYGAASLADAQSVPEPSTLVVLLAAAMPLAVIRRLRSRVVRHVFSLLLLFWFTSDAVAVGLVFSSDTQLVRAPIDGSGPVTVIYDASDYPASPAAVAPRSITVFGNYIYWSDYLTDEILRGPLDGSGPVEVLFATVDNHGADHGNGPRGVTVHDGMVYWSHGYDDTISRGAMDGSGEAMEVYNVSEYGRVPNTFPVGPHSLVVHENLLFWVDNSADAVLQGSPDGSGLVTKLYDFDDYPVPSGAHTPSGLTIVGDYLYWTDVLTDQILRAPVDGNGPVIELFSRSDYPGSPTSAAPRNIVAEGNFFYWTDSSTDQILYGAIDGSGPVRVLYNDTEFGLAIIPDPFPGDFNGDGIINGNDFLLWQQNPSIGDLTDWQASYGAASLAQAHSVPEPSTFVILLATVLLVQGLRRQA